MTLIELVVTLLLLSLFFGISISMSAHIQRDDHDARRMVVVRARAQVTRAREEALRTGRVVTVWVADTGGRADTVGLAQSAYALTAFPDGTVLAESVLAGQLVLDRLTGSLRKEARNAAP